MFVVNFIFPFPPTLGSRNGLVYTDSPAEDEASRVPSLRGAVSLAVVRAALRLRTESGACHRLTDAPPHPPLGPHPGPAARGLGDEGHVSDGARLRSTYLVWGTVLGMAIPAEPDTLTPASRAAPEETHRGLRSSPPTLDAGGPGGRRCPQGSARGSGERESGTS